MSAQDPGDVPLENSVVQNIALQKSDRRVKTLTPEGEILYNTNLKIYRSRFNQSWSLIESIPVKIDECTESLNLLQQLNEELNRYEDDFCRDYDALIAFLSRTYTVESNQEKQQVKFEYHKGKEIIDNLKRSIKEKRLNCMETLSQVSGTSTYKTRSEATASSILERKRMKVEAQRTRLKFIEKETALQRQMAELQSNILLLDEQRKAAVAEAELNVLEKQHDRSVSPTLPVCNDLSTANIKKERTASYVEEQSHYSLLQHNQDFDHTQGGLKSDSGDHVLNPAASCFQPASTHNLTTRYYPPTPIQRDNQFSVVNNVTQFLLKKDLLLSRFVRYDDKPESYACWKASFKNITEELAVTPFEETDLLIKWLGPQSSKYALSIRAANASNPDKGLKRIWDRLEERYGCPELVESALKAKLQNFPKLTVKDSKRLFELSDILAEIESTKETPRYSTLLAYFDSSSGIVPIINKLPYNLQEKWTMQAANYKKKYSVSYPPFSFLVAFIQDMSKIRNDPGFQYVYDTRAPTCGSHQKKGTEVKVMKTGMSQSSPDGGFKAKTVMCPIHKSNHSLEQCKAFKNKSFSERKKILRKHGICFRCCESVSHMARDCLVKLKCRICQSDKHHSLLHTDGLEQGPSSESCTSSAHGGEKLTTKVDDMSVKASCTQICKSEFGGKSCAKIVLVKVFPETEPDRVLQLYAIIDDQSNKSLAKTEFFNFMRINSKPVNYSISSCSGVSSATGRRACGFIVQSLDGCTSLRLPTLIECDDIPNSRDEIPTPEVAENHSHLKNLVPYINPLDDNSSILLLIGRDLAEAHHVLDQQIGFGSPYAQKLCLGWVLVGESCLSKIHIPDNVRVNKTYILPNGRSTILKPCESSFTVKEHITPRTVVQSDPDIGINLFETTVDDNKPGLSVNDREFIALMEGSFSKDSKGRWVAPLPFCRSRQKLPNNRPMALRRAMMLDKSLQRDAEKSKHFFAFMEGIFNHGFAEIAPPLTDGEECWYLPIFGVYNNKKPGKVRVVFDSSAKFNNVSLNDVLLSGPDLTNSLLGVLLRFRKEEIAITADIEQMFFGFVVDQKHRNFLRFLWHGKNDPDHELVEYRMCSHVFGNAPSPAVATYGLRKSVDHPEVQEDVKYFVNRNFYVDDALTSVPSPEEAIDLMKRTQLALRCGGNLHLHKIASNNEKVIEAFPVEDRSADLKQLDLSLEDVPLQRSLGIMWDLQRDIFTFQINLDIKPFTRRGVLSTLHTVYDPLGFASPVILQGRFLFRQLTDMTCDWDDPLPLEYSKQWNVWTESIHDLTALVIPRPYVPFSVQGSTRREIHIFSDASEKAVAAVSYLRAFDKNNQSKIGFLHGKSKLAPKVGHTIPRLELCSAVLASELASTILAQLDTDVDSVCFYTDSKVVLGYIYNRTRRFYTYVSNRVDKILKVSNSEQWRYVPSHSNPADIGTRGICAKDLQESYWLQPPAHVFFSETLDDKTFPLIDPIDDVEIRPDNILKLSTMVNLGTERFKKFSSWKSLVSAITMLRKMVRQKKFFIALDSSTSTVDELHSTEVFIIHQVQQEVYQKEILKLKNKEQLPKDSSLVSLNPFIDSDGLLRVGGRLNKSNFNTNLKNPVIIPKHCHVATLLILHLHNKVHHQGRHITEGALRNAGYWIIGSKRLVTSLIHKCVVCRKLRGKFEVQIMADVPSDRLQPSPPFTYVGVDTFGHWEVTARKTRGGVANSKRWAIIFTCLVTRAIHIEVIEQLTTSSFINALRRFVSIRGKVQEFRSDRGTNFVGSTDNLKLDAINVEDKCVKKFLQDEGTTWIFNPPHASHFGGVWERMIGVVRRVLDSLMLESPMKHMTHEVLITFMAEVCAIVNSRPIVPVSSDPDNPMILTPSVLLTQKVGCDVTPFDNFDVKEMYRSQWKFVQILADQFWKRWKEEYLHFLQSRRKWTSEKPNISKGDVVLLREKDSPRNYWPLGVINNVMPSSDGKVRKVEVSIIRNGQPLSYTRPINEIVLLFSPQS